MSVKDKVWLDRIELENPDDTVEVFYFSKRGHEDFLILYSEKDQASDKIVRILTAFNKEG